MSFPEHPIAHLDQQRLFHLADVDTSRFEDPLDGWTLTDVRALALDPDLYVRQVAALSNWNIDGRLQQVLATDPDESVVMLLLSRVDPAPDVVRLILGGPHPGARRELAGRNVGATALRNLRTDDDGVPSDNATAIPHSCQATSGQELSR